MGNSFLGYPTSRIYNSKQIFTFPTFDSTSFGDHCTFPLMSLNPLAPAFLPQFQFPSDPPISMGNFTTMSLPLAQLICGMTQPIIPSHASPINQPNTDGSFILPLFQPTNQSKQDEAIHQSLPGSSSLLPSTLQHQANCIKAIHKTIQQFNQHLKAEHLNRQTLQLIFLHLPNDFALLR